MCYERMQYFQSILNEFCDTKHTLYLQLLLLKPYVYGLVFMWLHGRIVTGHLLK
jgi:hypothetical protein